MKTRAEIAPTTDRRRFAEISSALERAGVIAPQRLGHGQPTLYTPEDAEIIRRVIDCPDTLPDTLRNLSGRVSGHPAQETQNLEGVRTPCRTPVRTLPDTQETGETSHQIPDPTEILRAELDSVRATVAAEREAREREAAALSDLRTRMDSEATARAAAETEARRAGESARELAAVIEREREERERIRIDADIERRHAIARISSLETAIKKGRPRTLRERIRAALDVLFGQSAAVPLLPESSAVGDELRKAA